MAAYPPAGRQGSTGYLPAGRGILDFGFKKNCYVKTGVIVVFYVYVLYSRRCRRKYVGMTQNISKRLKEHNAGKTKSTKGFAPWELKYFEEFTSSTEARKREIYFKAGAGREFLKRLLNLDL